MTSMRHTTKRAQRPHGGCRSVSSCGQQLACEPGHVQARGAHGGPSSLAAARASLPAGPDAHQRGRRRARPAAGRSPPAAQPAPGRAPVVAELAEGGDAGATQGGGSRLGGLPDERRRRPRPRPSRPSATAAHGADLGDGSCVRAGPRSSGTGQGEAALAAHVRGDAARARVVVEARPVAHDRRDAHPHPMQRLGGRARRQSPLGRPRSAPRQDRPGRRGSPMRPERAHGHQRGPPRRGRTAAAATRGTVARVLQQAQQLRRAGPAHRRAGSRASAVARSTAPCACEQADQLLGGHAADLGQHGDRRCCGRAPRCGPRRAAGSALGGCPRRPPPRPRRAAAGGAGRSSAARWRAACTPRPRREHDRQEQRRRQDDRVSSSASSEQLRWSRDPALRATKHALTRCSSSRGLNGLMT